MTRFVAIIALVSTVAFAQAVPGFAGTWKVSTGQGLGWGPELSVSQDAKALTVVSVRSGYKYVYNFDGSETTNSDLIGGQQIPQRCSLKRDGNKFILTAVYHAQGFDVRKTETWEIGPSGDLTIKQDYLQGNQDGERGGSSTTTYKKS